MSEIEELDALLEIDLVGLVVFVDGGFQTILLGAPRIGLALEVRPIDLAVQLVGVHRLDARLKAVTLGTEILERLGMERGLVREALAEGLLDPVLDLRPHVQLAEHVDEPPRQRLLARVGLPAFAFEAGAVVVDVAPFF